MGLEDLSLQAWHRHGDARKLELAAEVARDVGGDFRVVGLEDHELGVARCRLAVFSHDGARFVMVPGGKVEIGFSTESFTPSPAQLESYLESQEGFELPELVTFLARTTTLRRRVTVTPLLVEAVPREVGLEELPLDHREVRQALRQYRGGNVEVHLRLRLRRDETHGQRAWRIHPTSHAELSAELAVHRFRLATADEWEWLNGAGCSTLFRWGDHCPCDRFPTDPDDDGFDLHRRSNAFGLVFAADPYQLEVVVESDLRVGGDGGSAICGGVGFFLGWLALAPGYRQPHGSLSWGDEVATHLVRRVRELG
jgi:hypothetical protein